MKYKQHKENGNDTYLVKFINGIPSAILNTKKIKNKKNPKTNC